VARAVLGGAQQMRQGRVRAVQQAEHVELDHLLPFLQRRADRRAQQHHPRVVDERVEPAQLGHRALNDFGRLRLVGDVGFQHQRDAAAVTDVGRDRLQPVPAPRRQRHGRAVSGERDRRGRADTARSPRY